MTLQDFAYLGNPIEEDSYSGDLERTVIDRNGETVATLKAEEYNGHAHLDYAAVLRSIQQNEGVGTLATGCLYTNRDFALQVLANINSADYIFVRGVAQRSNIAATAFKFLTDMQELRHYSGYPLTISYIINNTSATNWSVRLDGEQYESSTALANMAQVLKAHVTSVLTTAPQGLSHADSFVTKVSGVPKTFVYYGTGGPSGRPYLWKGIESDVVNTFMSSSTRDMQVDDMVYSVATNPWPYRVYEVSSSPHTHGMLSLVNGVLTKDTILIREMPVPAHPFYVRWVNDLGGWDYFMFACNQKQTKSLSKNDTYEPYVTYGRYGLRSSYNKEATSAVEVSTGIIGKKLLKSVAECVYSPLVQLYDEALNSWIEIQPKTDKQEFMATQTTGELKMTFELPTPQLNK